MPELKWARNVRIEAGRQAGARPQELQPPQAQAQALRTEPLQGFELEESVATVRIAQPVPRSEYAAASSAIGFIHGVVAKFVILFSHVSTEWRTYVTPPCPVMKCPSGQVKFARGVVRSG
jgi:hypothetical protein